MEGESFIGADMDGVAARLRGAEGTRVWIRVKRGEDILSPKEILRGKVDIPTVSAAYMLDKKTAYIALSRFGSQAHTEMLGAIEELKAQGMRRLIFDLRNNGGGLFTYCDTCGEHVFGKGDVGDTYPRAKARESGI